MSLKIEKKNEGTKDTVMLSGRLDTTTAPFPYATKASVSIPPGNHTFFPALCKKRILHKIQNSFIKCALNRFLTW